MYLVHVELPEACFGFEVNDQGVIVNAAPIARWTLGRRDRQVVAYYRRGGGRVSWTQVPDRLSGDDHGRA